MMPKRFLPVLLLLLLTTGFSLPDAHARGRGPVVEAGGTFIRVAERAVSMRQAINQVRQQTGGRVLDAQDQGSHYRIKVLTPGGEVRIFRVDARTGAIR